jgi:hypothetical protein
MKLIFCRECGDIISLRKVERTCVCGKSSGQYTDDINARISGPCVPLGISNSSFKKAMAGLDLLEKGMNFDAFVINHINADTICGSSVTHE